MTSEPELLHWFYEELRKCAFGTRWRREAWNTLKRRPVHEATCGVGLKLATRHGQGVGFLVCAASDCVDSLDHAADETTPGPKRGGGGGGSPRRSI